MHTYDTLLLIFRLAMRNLFARRWKSLIVGAIIFFGTALIVVGDALLDSLEVTMSRSIIASLAGHLQVYSKQAKDPINLFPVMSLFDYDYGTLSDFGTLRRELEALDNVEAVIPMGPEKAIITVGNELDLALERLRKHVDAGETQPAEVTAEHIRQIVRLLAEDYKNVEQLAADMERLRERQAVIADALSPEFWDRFKTDPYPQLEVLENKVAPLSYDGIQTFMLYMGTDLERFPKYFDLYEIVDGEHVPPGKRGMVFSKRFYEQEVKHKVAAMLDMLRDRRAKGESIDTSRAVYDIVKLLTRQHKRITYQLDPEEAVYVEGKLRELLPAVEGDLTALVEEMLNVNDANFDARYAFFYEHIAPRISLYAFTVGDVMTIRTFTKSGYLSSTNVKVYGTFRFRGLETSDLTGIYNLMDLMSFRDLYGYMTEEKRAEMQALKEQFVTPDLARENIEDALFGGEATLVSEGQLDEDGSATAEAIAKLERIDFKKRDEELQNRIYTQAEIENGVFINAAVILKDGRKLKQTMQEIVALSEAKGLGLNVVDWQQASGFLGQLIFLFRMVLYIAVGIIFLVALVIVNILLVTATLERINEIGTLRAIGAQRGFIMLQFMSETLMLGMIAGGSGALFAAGLITVLGQVGIKAWNEVAVFFFGGNYLYPTIGPLNLAIGFAVVVTVSVVATLYPAAVATGVQPVEAMRQGRD